MVSKYMFFANHGQAIIDESEIPWEVIFDVNAIQEWLTEDTILGVSPSTVYNKLTYVLKADQFLNISKRMAYPVGYEPFMRTKS